MMKPAVRVVNALPVVLKIEAVAAFDRALALDAGSAEAWLGRGNVLVELNDYDGALAAFDKALALNSDLAGAWLGRGNAWMAIDRNDDALLAPTS